MGAIVRNAAALVFGLAAGYVVYAQAPLVDAAQEVARANALTQSGKPEEAIPIYRKLTMAFPHEPSLRINLAIALYKAKRYDETANECQALASTEPRLFAAWLFWGASRSKLGDARGAEAPLRKAVELKPDDPNAHILLADVFASTGQESEAVREYTQAAERRPALLRAWYGLGYGYALLASESLAHLRERDPSSAEALTLSGDLDLAAAQISKAFFCYQAAFRKSSDFPGLHAKIADIYLATGHSDWAKTERQKSQSEVPKGCPSGPKIECAVRSGQLEQSAFAQADSPQETYWQAQAFLELSRRAYAKLTALPASAEGYEAEARRAENRGQYPEAVAAWQKAIELDSGNDELQRGLALAQCHSNDCVSALPLLKKKATQNHASVEWNYLCGLSLITMRDPVQAIPYLENALRLDPTFADTKGVLGEAYLEAGRPREAIDLLKASLSGDSSGLRHYQLAQAYRASGDDTQTRETLKEYREIMQISRNESRETSAITPP